MERNRNSQVPMERWDSINRVVSDFLTERASKEEELSLSLSLQPTLADSSSASELLAASTEHLSTMVG